MNILILKDDTQIDDNLLASWDRRKEPSWEAYIKSLDSNIVSVAYGQYTEITFKKEEHITLFLLRWS